MDFKITISRHLEISQARYFHAFLSIEITDAVYLINFTFL